MQFTERIIDVLFEREPAESQWSSWDDSRRVSGLVCNRVSQN